MESLAALKGLIEENSFYQRENEVWRRTSLGLNEFEKALSLPV